MEIGWLLPLVAVVEITGGLLVIFPKQELWALLLSFRYGRHPAS